MEDSEHFDELPLSLGLVLMEQEGNWSLEVLDLGLELIRARAARGGANVRVAKIG